MIGYVTLGTSNLEKAGNFYDALFSTLGIGRFMEQKNHYIAWASGPDQPSLAVSIPFDGKAATIGNGTMVALLAKNHEEVARVYNKAIELGATDEGEPGFRGGENSDFYAAYFRDPDGNKLNIFCIEAPEPAG